MSNSTPNQPLPMRVFRAEVQHRPGDVRTITVSARTEARAAEMARECGLLRGMVEIPRHN